MSFSSQTCFDTTLQFWGTEHTLYPSEVQLGIQTLKYILQRYQNKFLRATVNAPRYISNKVLHTGLKVPTVREEITEFSVKYIDEMSTHPNELASTLHTEEQPRRL
jgi:hypothetical protein